MLDSLRTDNHPGRGVWHSESDIVDHRVVAVEFDDGATGTWSMVGNSAEPRRTLHIVGTKGEVFGTMEEGAFTVRRIAATGPQRSTTEEFAVSGSKDMHGGGDLRLVADFVNVLQRSPPSISTTAFED